MFDAHFAPAYYEDADLAFRVRSAGYRVYYQPLCRIVHFEGVSSGTSTDEGMKRFQLVNQKKFAERWRQTLQEHAPNGQTPELERERTVGKRALVLDACMLTPDRDSGSLRMFNLLRVLQSLGYKVSFCAENLQYLEEYTPPLQKLGIEVPYTPYVTSVEQYLEEHRQLYDVVLLSRADVAERFVDVVRRCASPATQVVFDTVDLHYLRELRLAEMNGGSAALRKAQRRKEQELGIAAKADVTLVVSPAEKRLLQEESSRMRVEVVSNIHEVHGCRRAFWERRDLLFVGGFQHPPNEDAVIYFVEQVFPKVLARLRGLNFHIVGSNPPARVRALASEHVHVAGFVPDLEPVLDSCRMTVAPLRYGAGVKGKVNTSMSYGVPVVATTTATEGMQLRDGVDVLIADDPQTFADAVVRLYGNEVLWNQLSNNGMANIERYFSFEAARQAMERALSPASVAGRVRHRPVRAGLSVGI
jgi:glycosyltransferase involved in cell wall biosynthesis